MNCDFCNSPVLSKDFEKEGETFCSSECLKNAEVLTPDPNEFTEEELNRRIEIRHQGRCPTCGGKGPLEVHSARTIWSLLVYSSYKTVTTVCCRSCASNMKIKSSLFSLLFGWWGIPEGIVKTPRFIAQDLISLFRKHDSSVPSDSLKRFAAMELVKIKESKSAQPGSPYNSSQSLRD